MNHEIDDDVTNTRLTYCIDEYVRSREHRNLLKDHWFEAMSFEELAEKYHLSVSAVKKIVYNIGDKILIKATEK